MNGFVYRIGKETGLLVPFAQTQAPENTFVIYGVLLDLSC